MNRPRLTFCLITIVIFVRFLLAISNGNKLGEDATLYHETATHIAWALTHEGTYETGLTLGTDVYAHIVGVVYSIFGNHPVAMTLLNTTVAGIGSFIFYGLIWSLYPRCHIAIKCFVVLDPSMLFWTSIHGKDPLAYFLIAVSVYSFYLVIKNRKWSLIFCFISLAMLAALRPHIAAIIALSAAITLATRFNRLPRSAKVFTAAACVAVIVIVALITSIVIQSGPTVISQIGGELESLSVGGSSLNAQVETWGDLFLKQIPIGLIATLFRPFPWDASNLNMAAAALYRIPLDVAEILVIAYFFKKRPMPLRAMVKFAGLCCLFLILFFTLTSSNLGTLDRMRVQLSPLIILLLAASSSRVHVFTFREVPDETEIRITGNSSPASQ